MPAIAATPWGSRSASRCSPRLGPWRARRRHSRRCGRSEHGLQAATDNGRLEVTSAYTAWLGAREIVTTQRKAVELAREGLSIAQVSYENGVITSTELNDARQSLLETEWELVQAQYAQIVAAASARLAAGQ